MPISPKTSRTGPRVPLMTLETLAALGATVGQAMADPGVLRAYTAAYRRAYGRASVLDARVTLEWGEGA
jgi:hypothetical protein